MVNKLREELEACIVSPLMSEELDNLEALFTRYSEQREIEVLENLMGQSYHTEKSETVVRIKMRLERLREKLKGEQDA